MRVRWDFFFECSHFQFDRAYKFSVKIHPRGTEGLSFSTQSPEVFMIIRPDEKSKSRDALQTGVLQIVLPGDIEETRQLAYRLALNAAAHISFFNGELTVSTGLVMGERLPDTKEEADKLGNSPYFAEAHLIEAERVRDFDPSSLRKLGGDESVLRAIRQYNAAVKAQSPIDQFLGFFKILEYFYYPAHSSKSKMAERLKESSELCDIISRNLCSDRKDKISGLPRDECLAFIDAIARVRHECAHLRRAKTFGIAHGDSRIEEEVLPLLAPLSHVAFETIWARMAH